ncbi:hypothetical protein CEXT_601111 [Caerostris extrusa]|uniref:Uncharacterized protein n=1 Tax=Caerostris extrusa TaxID=172846 RepID=A0AAV4M6G0_CAEEX|nr:hypothetical protein CEXT_601111 [Caerostris extrusa]
MHILDYSALSGPLILAQRVRPRINARAPNPQKKKGLPSIVVVAVSKADLCIWSINSQRLFQKGTRISMDPHDKNTPVWITPSVLPLHLLLEPNVKTYLPVVYRGMVYFTVG